MKNKRADRILSLFLMFQIFLAGTAFASPIGKVREEKRNSEQNLSEVRREIEDLENQKSGRMKQNTRQWDFSRGVSEARWPWDG